MSSRWIWLVAIALYGAFELWYGSWRRPLTHAEIETYMTRIQSAREEIQPERIAAIRAFLKADDGGEFFMANLVRVPESPVEDPESGELRPAQDVLRGYTDYFIPALLRRAGHPAFVGRAAGGYVEHWGVEPDPGWTLVAVVRYRSRRDMMELATDPRFARWHAFKTAAMSHTLALPVAPGTVLLGPRVGVGLLLALLAALAQLRLRRT